MKSALLVSLLMISFTDVYPTQTKAWQATINESAEATVKILLEQPESIEIWKDNKVYLAPEKIVVLREGVFVHAQHSDVRIPSFAIDDQGVFILCSKEEAQEHYDRAWEALRDAVGHSIGAGAAFAIEQPLVGVYEGYRAVEKYKEFGREYSQGVEAESGGTIGSYNDSKD